MQSYFRISRIAPYAVSPLRLNLSHEARGVSLDYPMFEWVPLATRPRKTPIKTGQPDIVQSPVTAGTE